MLLEVANSLLEESTPGDITAATQLHQATNHPSEGKQDDSTKANEPDLLDHGLTLFSHRAPLDPAIPTLRRLNSLRCSGPCASRQRELLDFLENDGLKVAMTVAPNEVGFRSRSACEPDSCLLFL